MAGILDNPVGNAPVLQVDPLSNSSGILGQGSIGAMQKPNYAGQHEAPDMESGSPLHDVTLKTYPKDFYGPSGFQYYNPANEGGMDWSAYNKIVGLKDQPDQMVTAYRAIPWDGPPPGYSLNSGGPAGGMINPGDWVAINRDYAKMHGESALNGNYAIVTKKIPAKQLFTNGDSFHEWGWDPRAQ